MKDVAGKVAVITGAASGIGRGIAEAFAAAQMKVVLSDVERPALEATAQALRSAGADVRAFVADVSKREQVEQLARETLREYGAVHVLCNNAGVGLARGAASWDATLDDWSWVMGVNLMGVVHGQRTFIPIMLEQGDDAHIVNTASLAGLVNGTDTIYGLTKAAVIRLSEGTFLELQSRGAKISVSVVCPGFVSTNIMEAERNRPSELSETKTAPHSILYETFREWFAGELKQGLDARTVGDQVLSAIREQRFYVLTHPDWNFMIEKRMQSILSGGSPAPAMPPGFQKFLDMLRERTSGKQ